MDISERMNCRLSIFSFWVPVERNRKIVLTKLEDLIGTKLWLRKHKLKDLSTTEDISGLWLVEMCIVFDHYRIKPS